MTSEVLVVFLCEVVFSCVDGIRKLGGDSGITCGCDVTGDSGTTSSGDVTTTLVLQLLGLFTTNVCPSEVLPVEPMASSGDAWHLGCGDMLGDAIEWDVYCLAIMLDPPENVQWSFLAYGWLFVQLISAVYRQREKINMRI